MGKKAEITLLFFLAFLPSLSFAELSQEALLDYGLQTTSLQEYYDQRNSSRDYLFLSAGADGIAFRDYRVLTEFGTTDLSLTVANSHLNFSLPAGLVFFRGLDLSGRAIALGKSFSIDGRTFSEPFGTIISHELYVALFSLWFLNCDIGISRNRLYSDVQDTGVLSDDWLGEIGSHLMPRSQDTLGFFYRASISDLLFMNLGLRDELDYLHGYFSLQRTLELLKIGILPNWMKEVGFRFLYSEAKIKAGLKFSTQTPSPTGWSMKLITEGELIASFSDEIIELVRMEAMAFIDYWVISVKGSYLKDVRLIPFGAPDTGVWGQGISFGVRFGDKQYLQIIYSFAQDLETYLRFMPGSYKHPVHHLAFKVNL